VLVISLDGFKVKLSFIGMGEDEDKEGYEVDAGARGGCLLLVVDVLNVQQDQPFS
jgi:hypothetical protein